MKNLSQRSLSIILSVIGLVDAIYLYIIKISNNKNLCLQGIGDCWSVNISRFSEVGGIPISLFGAAAFLAIIVLIWLEGKNQFIDQYGPTLIFGITLFGTIYSIYLTYVEIYILRAICPFCVISAVMMVSLFVIAVTRIIKNFQAD